MNEYNDYVNMTKGYLKSYKRFKVQIVNMREDIEAMRREMDMDAAAPIAQYGGETGGGTPELNSVEAAASRNMAASKRIEYLEHEIDVAERKIRQIDRTLAAIRPEDADLIRMYYFEGMTWAEIGIQKFLTEKWVRNKCNRAVKEIAQMIFGSKAAPVQQCLFVFAE
jgi:DNA-directed RNA polymerase specialized sigma24 family protein